MKLLLKEKEEAAEASRNKALAEEADKIKIAKEKLDFREKLLDQREAKLQEASARLEEANARLAEEKRAFEQVEALAATEAAAKKAAETVAQKTTPWYRRHIF